MNKSLIALATLVAFAGAASAQSSVTIGGFVELAAGKPTGTTDKGMIDIGGSRLNFGAVEDLGGGMKAIMGIEHRLSPDTGAQTRPAVFWDGYSWVGLSGGFGTVRLGRWYTTSFLMVQNQIDPFRGDTVAGLRNASMNIGPAKVRFSNGLRYDNSFGGMNFAFDISEKGQDRNTAAADATIVNKPWSAAVNYASGPLFFGLSHENPGGKNDSLTNLGARYAIGSLSLRAGMSTGKLDNANSSAKIKGYLLGATFDAGAGQFKIGYATNKTSGYTAAGDLAKNKTNAKRFAVGYQYNLSKRTFLFTDFARDSSLATNRTGYDFGIRHNF